MKEYVVNENEKEVVILIRSNEEDDYKPNSIFTKHNKFSRKQVEKRKQELEDMGYELKE